ncbi:MAG: hypothetical protein HY834_00955 [Devosia nanyangense]|uniref:Uncharacterized protein n=1 Tax=Devosia nanyangense TaxID=1228055 RepID=A0A933KZD3_9HYPH|nr:hypothetical protein [Devosia nanyangense]
MRLSATCLSLFMLTFPAAAAETIADQAQHAYDVFAGGLSQQAFLSAELGQTAFRNVAGNWVRLNGPDSKTGTETYGADTEKQCKTPATLTLASPTPMSLTLTTNLKGTNFTQSYELIAGSTFGEHTDPLSYFAAVGLGPDKVGDSFDQQRALLLSVANGLVQIYRPSDDILVLTRDRGYPIVLARCPAK